MDDWDRKVLIASVPVVLAIAGWALSLETRLQQVSLIVQERSTNLVKIDATLDTILANAGRQEANKLLLDNAAQRIERLETRVNGLHNYLMELPIRPPPFNGRRGDAVSPILRQ